MVTRVVVADKFIEGDDVLSGKDVICEMLACLSSDLRQKLAEELEGAIENTSKDKGDEAERSLSLLLVAQKYTKQVTEEFANLGK